MHVVPNFIISINILLKRAEDKAPNKRAEDKAPIMVRTKLNVCYAWTQFKTTLILNHLINMHPRNWS